MLSEETAEESAGFRAWSLLTLHHDCSEAHGCREIQHGQGSLDRHLQGWFFRPTGLGAPTRGQLVVNTTSPRGISFLYLACMKIQIYCGNGLISELVAEKELNTFF